jgi:CRISPR-associated exonuclease Cas4
LSDPPQYLDEDLLPLRYLNDLLFCERRLALHLVEQIWKDNQYTAEGVYAHKKVDQSANLKRGEKRNVTGMMLVSYRLGVTGKADLVEFRSADVSSATPKKVNADGTSALRVPYPVDFKRGKKRRWDNDEVQLCAQAMCLEEMLNVPVPKGAIFHIKSQHRREVLFDEPLRYQTITAAARLHEIVRTGITPRAEWRPRCKGCSLLETCMPKAWRPKATAAKYLESLRYEE